MEIFEDIGISIPKILLPRGGTDLSKWAVIACDQFTSEPEYWRKVQEIVGTAPSTLNLVLPEIELEAPGKEARVRAIQQTMHRYLADGQLEPRTGMVYVERRVDSRVRRGLLLCLDLERYDFRRGTSSLIRATEGTIVERLPPRMAIREGAALELPHILVLIDDPSRTVIEPLQARAAALDPLYDFELMLGSGHLTGYGLGAAEQESVVAALRNLAQPAAFQERYGLGADQPILLFAMGDGNHSLATAKAVWDGMKDRVGMQHPARYALVEIENVHDDGLAFEPIHRILFGLRGDLLKAVKAHGGSVSQRACGSAAEMFSVVDAASESSQVVGLVTGGSRAGYGILEFADPPSNLAVGTVQPVLDRFMEQGGAARIDYVHGADVVERLGAIDGNAALYLPRMAKSSLFKTVILDGALPRKTFSMGEAREKRFYMEARGIA